MNERASTSGRSISKRKIVLGIGVAAVLGSVSAVGVTAVRYRISGTGCIPITTTTFWNSSPTGGMEIRENPGAINADAVTCAIPTGPGLVDLGDGSHTITQVDFFLRQETVAATIATATRAHDNNSASFCTCGFTSASVAANTFTTRNVAFNCGACAIGTDWSAVGHVSRNGDGLTTVKQMVVNAP